jgi:hypothetical protein
MVVTKVDKFLQPFQSDIFPTTVLHITMFTHYALGSQYIPTDLIVRVILIIERVYALPMYQPKHTCYQAYFSPNTAPDNLLPSPLSLRPPFSFPSFITCAHPLNSGANPIGSQKALQASYARSTLTKLHRDISSCHHTMTTPKNKNE